RVSRGHIIVAVNQTHIRGRVQRRVDGVPPRGVGGTGDRNRVTGLDREPAGRRTYRRRSLPADARSRLRGPRCRRTGHGCPHGALADPLPAPPTLTPGPGTALIWGVRALWRNNSLKFSQRSSMVIWHSSET